MTLLPYVLPTATIAKVVEVMDAGNASEIYPEGDHVRAVFCQWSEADRVRTHLGYVLNGLSMNLRLDDVGQTEMIVLDTRNFEVK